ncbi:MAG: hypothetical protein ABSF83_00075 [Nitrososphaerales archaeon]|jgi:hypothetical protein
MNSRGWLIAAVVMIVATVFFFFVFAPVVFEGDPVQVGPAFIGRHGAPFYVSPSCRLMGAGTYYWGSGWNGTLGLGCQPPMGV